MRWIARAATAVGVVALSLAGLTAPASAAPAACTAAQLAGAFGQTDGAAGTIYNVFVLTNVSGATCTMKGYPGIKRFGPNGRAQGTTLATNIAPAPATVTLAAGAKASFVWAYSDVPEGNADSCPNTRVLGISAPGSSARLYIATKVPYCSSTLRVSAVAAGVITP